MSACMAFSITCCYVVGPNMMTVKPHISSNNMNTEIFLELKDCITGTEGGRRMILGAIVNQSSSPVFTGLPAMVLPN
uniref:Uncharacterized protein n=1 Tax=Anguilla anguilla TaxID=7936 RepID=A0A0E9VRW4_ANGAN